MTKGRLWSTVAIVLAAGLLASPVQAVEICGLSDGFFKSSFESGELPAVTLPLANTPVSLAITAPIDNSTVGTRTVQVTGTWGGPPNTGITVNGAAVLANFTSFASTPVALQSGSNTITVVLTTQDGATQTLTRTVTYDSLQAPDVEITANSSGDLAPIQVSYQLNLRAGLPLTVVRIQADYDGDNSFDLDTNSVATGLSFSYLDPGSFDARFVVTLDDSDPMTPPVTRTIIRRVVVLNPNQIRQTLCQVYGDMRSRLRQLPTADISGALNTLDPTLRTEFQSFWNGLGSGLDAAVANLGDIADGGFSQSTADYLVVRPVVGTPGEYDGFPLRFEKDIKAVWRISGM